MSDDKKLKACCYFTSGESRKSIFQFKENNDGSVNLRIKSGLQIGIPPDNKVIKDERISIHSTVNDPTFNTIKTHLEYQDGTKEPNNYFRTDAIKAKNKFAHITTMRLSDLKHAIYSLNKTRSSYEYINLGFFNPAVQTALVSIFVGDRNAVFDCPQENISKFEITSKHFKFVILATYWILMPAGPTANSYHSFTSGYSVYLNDDPGIERHFYNGRTAKESIETMSFMQTLLMTQHVNEVISRIGHALQPDHLKFMQQMREQLLHDLGTTHHDQQINTMVINHSKVEF